jgi:hypothetical protein
MPKWSEIDETQIEVATGARIKFSIGGGPLRFQIPRGVTEWGVGSYKSLQVTVHDESFIEWFQKLERTLCPGEPYKSNLTGHQFRIKVDDRTLVFDQDAKFVTDEIREGFLKGKSVSCIIDIDGSYFYKGTWGLSIRAHHIKYYADVEPDDEPAEQVLKGCSFLPIE